MASRKRKTIGISIIPLLGLCIGAISLVAILGMSTPISEDGDEPREVYTDVSPLLSSSNDAIVPAPPGQYGDMVRLPDETFIIGLTDEDPYGMQAAGRREITVSSFYMDRFEVTNGEYREFLSSIPSEEREQRTPSADAWGQGASAESQMENYFRGSARADYPVVGITWDDAKAYCEWNGRRLPTEAEWEYAARSGRTGGIYPWQGISAIDARGRYLANFSPSEGRARTGYAFTAPVGSYPPSRWGIHDMAGNVAEWVEDAYTPTYDDFPVTTETPVVRDEDNSRRVIRGGSWASSSFEIGVGVRDFQERDQASTQVGIRCAADLIQVEGGMPAPAPAAAPPAEEDPDGLEPSMPDPAEEEPEFPEPDEEPEFPEPPSQP